MLEEVEGPGISARGVSFAGLNFYVEIGRGQSYSWSATSGGSYDLVMYRTDYGLVQYLGTIGGKPYAFAVQRSAYVHEA
jgi:acyl-homoserine lactone acylase PvdQ